VNLNINTGHAEGWWWPFILDNYWIWACVILWWAWLRIDDLEKLTSRTGVAIILILAILWYVPAVFAQERYGFDFPVYYWAALGRFDKIIPRGKLFGIGWVYKDFTRWTWWPFTLFDLFSACQINYWLMVACMLGIFKKAKEFRYGSVLFILLFPLWQVNLHAGNIHTALVLLCFSPFGSLLAILYKPYLAVFACLHAVRFWLHHRKPQGSLTWTNPNRSPDTFRVDDIQIR